MPKFHFDIVDGYTVPDPSGLELPTEQAAKKVAQQMAEQIALDVESGNFKDVVVKTDGGNEVFRAPIKSN